MSVWEIRVRLFCDSKSNMKLESSHWSLTIVPNERSYKILPTSFRTFQLQAFQHKTIRLLDVSNNAFQIGNSNFVYIIANKINEKRYNFGNSGFANTSRITIQNIIIFHSISLWVWLVWPIALIMFVFFLNLRVDTEIHIYSWPKWPLLRGRLHHPLLIVSTKMRIFEFLWFWITIHVTFPETWRTNSPRYSQSSPNLIHNSFFSGRFGVKTTNWNRASKCRNSKTKRAFNFESIEPRNW